jgi:ribosomal protein L19
MSKLENEEVEKLKMLKNFEYPDFNVGDVVRFHYLHSISEGRGNTYTGIVIAKYFL